MYFTALNFRTFVMCFSVGYPSSYTVWSFLLSMYSLSRCVRLTKFKTVLTTTVAKFWLIYTLFGYVLRSCISHTVYNNDPNHSVVNDLSKIKGLITIWSYEIKRKLSILFGVNETLISFDWIEPRNESVKLTLVSIEKVNHTQLLKN